MKDLQRNPSLWLASIKAEREKRELVQVGRNADAIREQCRSLAGFVRAAWKYIDPADFVDNWHIDAVCSYLEDVTFGRCRRLIINMPPRHMKGCADSTPIVTPDGMRKHGDLRVGDKVFGPDGRPVTVIARSEPLLANLEVVFVNGDVIKVNGDHLWTVYDRWAHKWKTIDTATLMSLQEDKGRSRFFVPDHGALDMPHADLPLHPYFLGCWLGDGTSTATDLSHDRDDRAHIDKLARLGYAATRETENGGNGIRSSFCFQRIQQTLRTLGVFGQKRIPERYFSSSIDQRKELLSGLIDTDGNTEANTGRVRISTTDPDLASDIERLAFSLGFQAYTITAKAPGYGRYAAGHKLVFQVGFQPTVELPIALERKQIKRTEPAHRLRGIREVRSADEPEIGHCINVDRDDGLYVVGRTHVVTHNSLLVSVAWPAWVWTLERSSPLSGPGVGFLATSYAHSLSVRDNVKCRRLIESPWYRALWGDHFALTGDQNTKIRFENNRGGYRIASSVDGTATGEGGSIVMFDDPISAKDSNSATTRDGVNEWWDNTMSTRLNNPKTGAYVGVMQRLHEDDLVGHIMAQAQPGEWMLLCLPARYEAKHPHIWSRDPRTVEGELLWPARVGETEMRALEISLGSYGTAGQLQQRPAPEGGGIFKMEWWKHFRLEALPPVKRIVQSWDTAFKAKTTNDYSVCTTWAECETGYYLLHVWKDRVEFPELKRVVVSLSAKYRPQVILVEDKASGQSLLQEMQRETRLPMIPVKVDADKLSRAYAVTPLVQAGRVFLPEGAPWVADFMASLGTFPNASHDDDVDSTTQALNYLSHGGGGHKFVFA